MHDKIEREGGRLSSSHRSLLGWVRAWNGEECLDDRRGVRESGGFDDNVVKLDMRREGEVRRAKNRDERPGGQRIQEGGMSESMRGWTETNGLMS